MKVLRKVNKKAILKGTCATVAAVMLLTVGTWSAFAGGVLATDKTIAQNEAIWGKPSVIQKFNDGTEKRFYKYNPGITSGFRYFVCKDGQVINDGGFTYTTPKAQKEQPDYQVITVK